LLGDLRRDDWRGAAVTAAAAAAAAPAGRRGRRVAATCGARHGDANHEKVSAGQSRHKYKRIRGHAGRHLRRERHLLSLCNKLMSKVSELDQDAWNGPAHEAAPAAATAVLEQ